MGNLIIKNLNYGRFEKLNFSVLSKEFVTIIGPNKSGKTSLFRCITGFDMTNNVINCDNIILNETSISLYLQKVGIIPRIDKYSFNFEKVIDELNFPLENLSLKKNIRNMRIKKYLDYFDMNNIVNKKIKDLTNLEKQRLLIVLAFLHEPCVVIANNALDIFPISEKKKLIIIIKKIIMDNNMAFINFTNNLEGISLGDRIVILNNYTISQDFIFDESIDDDIFIKNNIELPFIFDLSNKLKLYGLINHRYSTMKEMVNDIWK